MAEQLPGGSRPGDAAGAGDGDEVLRRLAERLLAKAFPGGPDMGEVRLLPGRLPDRLPVEIPLPEGSRVLGSMLQGPQLTAVVDTSLSYAEVKGFYQAWLTAAGWRRQEPFGGHGGFVASEFEDFMGTVYCHGPQGPSLRVQVFAVAGGPTDLRLVLQTDPRDSSCAPRRMPPGFPAFHEVIPALEPPPGARQFPDGGHATNGRHSSDARLQTDLGLEQVVAHYEQQLEGAGWSRQEAGVGDPAAWSTWTFQDPEGQPWRGIFFVLRRPDMPGEHIVGVRAESPDADPDFSLGGFSYDVTMGL